MASQVVSSEEWLAARRQLHEQEKAEFAARQEVNAARRRLPMRQIDQGYVFDGPDGKVSLLDLFEGKRQLVTYHFMFDPEWEEGCKHCSFVADNIGDLAHLHALDTTIALVSRAPYGKIAPFKERMGWTIPWVSSHGTRFNYDFHVTLDEEVAPVEYDYMDKAELEQDGRWFTEGEAGGMSVFWRADDDTVYHTYSAYGDGIDILHGTLLYADMTPLGRRDDLGRDWLRHHDRYAAAES